MKGRRHRLQYKKKVNPELVVDVKPSLRQRKLQEEKLRRQQMRDEYWRRRDEERLGAHACLPIIIHSWIMIRAPEICGTGGEYILRISLHVLET